MNWFNDFHSDVFLHVLQFKGNWGNLNYYSLSCTTLIPIIFIIITAVIVILTVVNFATIIIIVLSSGGTGSKFIFSTLSVV